MRDNVAIHERLTDATFRGALALPDGRTGLVFEGGAVMAVSNPKILSDFEAESILAEAERTLRSEAATLAAIGNTHGNTTERAAAAFADAAGIEPHFLHEYDAIGVSGGADRKFRDEQLARETPDV